MVKKLIAILLFVLFAIGFTQVRNFWLKKGDEGTEVNFVVNEGDGGEEIARYLKNQELIPSAFWFRVYLRLDGESRNLQVGTFELQKGMNYRSIVKRLGVAYQEEVVVTIPEGMTLEEMYDRINAVLPIEKKEWDLVVGPESPLESHPFIISAKKPDSVSLEGYLFPETYRFFATATAEDVVRVMLAEMEENTKGLALGKHKTLHEALTLASIIEKEVRKPETMLVVSGIFHNRLEIGMALQADATVNYITGKDDSSALLKDTQIDSPYNTYKYPGLPPGPISAPGMNAITASVSPATTDYFYYLTSPEGMIYYGKTFEEHVANRQYLR